VSRSTFVFVLELVASTRMQHKLKEMMKKEEKREINVNFFIVPKLALFKKS
jgi:hypothetical protein